MVREIYTRTCIPMHGTACTGIFLLRYTHVRHVCARVWEDLTPSLLCMYRLSIRSLGRKCITPGIIRLIIRIARWKSEAMEKKKMEERYNGHVFFFFFFS